MKKISDLIKENASQEFIITATVTFKVTAESEGDAGYTADSIIEGIEGYVSHEIGDVSEDFITTENIDEYFDKLEETGGLEQLEEYLSNFELENYEELANAVSAPRNFATLDMLDIGFWDWPDSLQVMCLNHFIETGLLDKNGNWILA